MIVLRRPYRNNTKIIVPILMATLRPRWTSQTKLTVGLLLLAIFVFFLYQFRVVIGPLILALILAYVLSPAVNRIQLRLRIPRGLATLLAYLILLLILALLLALVVPPLAGQISGLNVDFLRILEQVETALAGQILLPGGLVIDSSSAVEQFRGTIQNAVEPIFGRTLEVLVDAISSLVWGVFILVISFYLIKDWPALRNWFDKNIPPGYRLDIVRLRDELNKIWSAFFRGQLLLAFVVSMIFTVIGLALGLPFAFAMAVLAGLLEFLPSVGHGIWLSVATILAFFLGSTYLNIPNWIFALILIGLHSVFQQFDLNYLIPRIIGRSVHLPPLVVILGIVTGAALGGVLGIVLAAPSIASARIIGRYIYAYLFDTDPFPEETAPPLPPPDPDWWRLRGRPTIGQSVEDKDIERA